MQPVLLINSLGPGGAERVLVNVANEWHASGRKCRIVSMYGGPMAQQLASGVDLQIWNCRTRAALPRLRNLICELNPADPILVFSTAPAVLLGALRRLGVCKNPIIYREPNAARSKASLATRLKYRWFVSGYDAYIAQSPATESDLRAMTGTTRQVHLIQNACRFVVDRPTVTFHLPRADQRGLKCLTVGHLKRQKGYDRLVPAFRKLLEAYPESELSIAGDGPSRDEVHAIVNASGIADRIRMLGSVQPVQPLYDAADVMILASYFEGLPNVVIEAIALGCPVIVADGRGGTVGFMEELGLSDFIVRGNFVENLPAAISRLCNSSQETWQQARARMIDKVHPASVANRFWDVLDKYSNCRAEKHDAALKG